MTKMEALRDVKITLASAINKLETYVFIENIDDVVETKSIEPKEVTYETK